MSTARVKISPPVGEVLRAGSVRDNVYYLPPAQLEGGMYRRVADVLSAMGADWDKSQSGFPVGDGFAATLASSLESGIAFDPTRDEAIDPTRQPVADGADHPGPAEWLFFTMANGHIPFAADTPPTWAYSGWLRHLVLEAEAAGALLPRWHYVFESIDNGHVLDKPLPQTDMGRQGSGERASRIFMGWCELLDGRRSQWERMRLVMEFLAWGFGIGDSPPDLSHEESLRLYAGHEGRRGVNSRDLLDLYKYPCDLFGYTLSQKIGNGWNPNAFFPTPETVVACMVQMTMHDTKGLDQRGLTVCDPCVGTGRMLIYAGQNSMRLFGMDIDYMMVLATKINMAFWCPWGLYQWDDSFFDVVGLPGPPVLASTGQLALFGGTVALDVKNKGRPRAEVQVESYAKTQTGLFK